MRTYLTRLTFSAAGVVLTGIGFAAAAHASEGPSIESVVPVQQEPEHCAVRLAIPDCAAAADDDSVLTFPVNPEMRMPSWWDDVTPRQPDDDIPDEPEDRAPADDSVNEDVAAPADEPGDAADAETDGDAGQSSSGAPTGPDEISAAEASVDEPTPESEETTVAPAARSSLADDRPDANLLVPLLAAALAALGLGTIGFALGQPPSQAPRRNRR